MSTAHARHKPIPLPEQYSAEQTRSDGDSSKIYIDSDKRRTDAFVNGEVTTTIYRPDLGCTYMLWPSTRQYVRSTLPKGMTADLNIEDGNEWEYVGRETLGSVLVDVYLEYAEGFTKPLRRIYVDAKTNIRLRTVSFNMHGHESLTVDTKNVQIGPPDSNVFEIPDGYCEA